MKLRVPEILECTREKLAHLDRYELSDHLERGGLIKFPEPPIELPSEDDAAFLRDVTPQYYKRKNVSYYPDAGRLNGMAGPDEHRARTRRILREHHGQVEAFMRGAIPSLAKGWTSATSSLRPFQEKDRDLPIRQRSDLIHLDAGTYGATHGDLILRFLTNLDDQDRVWKVKGTAPDLIETLGEAAGLHQGNLTRDGLLRRAYTGALGGVSTLFPMARRLDGSTYDQSMRRIHNHMKESEAFQRDPEGAAEVHFPPRSCWMVFADMAGHACSWGRFAIIDTFIVPKVNFRHPENTPHAILGKLECAMAPR